MSEKFTQGEWYIEKSYDNSKSLDISTDELTIATVWGDDSAPEADANLILASRDMYHAIKLAIKDYEEFLCYEKNSISGFKALYEALAKADGNHNNTYTPPTKCINCEEVMVENGVCNCCG